MHEVPMSMYLPPLNPDTRRPINVRSFCDAYFVSLLCLYSSAFFTVRGYPLLVRLAWLPVALLSFYRACVTLDMTRFHGDIESRETTQWLNQAVLLQNVFATIKVLTWISSPRPTTQDGSSASALSLTFGFRELPYTSSSRVRMYVPRDWRSTSSRTMFILQTFASFLFHLTVSDVMHAYIQSQLGPFPLLPDPSSVGGSTPTLWTTFITLLAGSVVYAVIQSVYDLSTLIGILILRQAPAEWPPVFDRPWIATSLSDFWGRRWHQLFKIYFVGVGCAPAVVLSKLALPIPKVVVKAVGVIGVFLVSGVLHFLGGWGMGRGAHFDGMGGFFVVNGVGVLMEQAWKGFWYGRKSGSGLGSKDRGDIEVQDTSFYGKLRPILGWMWTISWILFWGNYLIDGWVRVGLIETKFYPEGWRPAGMFGMEGMNLSKV